jgi:hypothetical protein
VCLCVSCACVLSACAAAMRHTTRAVFLRPNLSPHTLSFPAPLVAHSNP